MTNIRQADTETVPYPWTVNNAAGTPTAPTSITFHARQPGATDVVWTVDGAGGTINGVVDDADGTGTWTITTGDLGLGTWTWWAIAVIGTTVRIPDGLTGTLHIYDR